MKIQWSCTSYADFPFKHITARAEGFSEVLTVGDRELSMMHNFAPMFKGIESRLRKAIEFSLAVDHLRSAVDSQMRYEQITGRNAECVALPLETAKTLLEMLK